MKKKGQAAMEFLMTYGWAILAAIIVIAVIAIYFRPSTLVQNSVTVNAPFYGVAVNLAAPTIQVELRNNGGEDLTTNNATLSFNSPSTGTCDTGTGTGVINAGATQVMVFSNCNLASGNTINADLIIEYKRPDSTLAQQATGSVSGKVA